MACGRACGATLATFLTKCAEESSKLLADHPKICNTCAHKLLEKGIPKSSKKVSKWIQNEENHDTVTQKDTNMSQNDTHEAQEPPKVTQWEPKVSQTDSKWAQSAPKGEPNGPKRLQKCSKMEPKWLPKPPQMELRKWKERQNLILVKKR